MTSSTSIVRPSNSMRRFIDVKTPMRDGVHLSSDIVLPSGEGPFPAILMRTPYDNSQPNYLAFGRYFAQRGFAFIVQDVRGRGDSDGEWIPFMNEMSDGYDTVEWIAAQPWCTGKVGMMGGSYAAHVQWMAAKTNPPHLAALSSTASPGRWLEDGLPYRNGILSLELFAWFYLTHGRSMQSSIAAYEGVGDDPLGMNWAQILRQLPLSKLDELTGFYSPMWHEWLGKPDLSDYWYQVRMDDAFSKINLPTLHITGWFDDCMISTIFNYEQMLAQSPATNDQYVVIGPWDHHGTREPQRKLYGEDFGDDAVADVLDLQNRFFDRYLKDGEVFEQSKVNLFVLGENRWRSQGSWTLSNANMTPFYLDATANAKTLEGDGILSTTFAIGTVSDTYVYYPSNPTPAWINHDEKWSPQDLRLDQRFVQIRDDVLVFTSQKLAQPLEIAGTPTATIYISSDAPDTDFYVTLCDVYPDKRSIRIAWGALRTRYRESLHEAKLMTPGEIYPVRIELAPIVNVFQAGHHIRVDIRSANFPLYDRNPNTGHTIGEDAEMKPAVQSLYHSEQYPSCILLPVVNR
ncbi:MAG: CocE/NonD family hydrolase [Anaerolineaceae bacterium]|nr:CocE/NonD family hydrolase [Anaerolineaceae bacterium]